MAVTSLNKLKEIAEGIEIELPGWTEEPFACKVKRPSLLSLVAQGAIPNELLNEAYSLFYATKKPGEKIDMKEHYGVLNSVARAALVEPTYDELESIGLGLTDSQLLEIYNFVQIGVRGLGSFRKKQKDNENSKAK